MTGRRVLQQTAVADTPPKAADASSDPVLCYVEDCWAWFTTRPLAEQWGDDWNDAPYEHNAGAPYAYGAADAARGVEPWDLVKVAWDGPFDLPRSWHFNSPWSVEAINAGAVPWLGCGQFNSHGIDIHAGTPLGEFVRKVHAAGGNTYVAVPL